MLERPSDQSFQQATIAARRSGTGGSRLVRRSDPSAVEAASQALLRNLAEASQSMNGAEPGSDDFLVAYQRATELRRLHRELRQTRRVPRAVWSLVQ